MPRLTSMLELFKLYNGTQFLKIVSTHFSVYHSRNLLGRGYDLKLYNSCSTHKPFWFVIWWSRFTFIILQITVPLAN